MKKLALIVVVVVTALTACKKELPEVGGTGAEKVANEWWVRLTSEGTDLKNGYFKIATYNTATGKDSIWVNDSLSKTRHGYVFKTKAKVDYSNLTFATANAQNAYFDAAHPEKYTPTVSITNGKVLLGEGRSKTGNVTDSIYMELEFANNPGVKYVMSGYARTAYIEDDY